MEHMKLEFTEKELAAMQEVSSRMDISSDRAIYSYALSGQNALMQLLDAVQQACRNRDESRLEEAFEETEAVLRKFRTEETLERRIFGLFRKKQNQEAVLQQKQDAAAAVVAELSKKLEQYHLELMKDMELLTEKEAQSQDCFRMLMMYIRAGKLKLARERETTLANLREIAKRTNLKQDIASAENYERSCRKFELKLRDLETTAGICREVQPLITELKNSDGAFSQTVHQALVGEVSHWPQDFCTEELSAALEQILASQTKNAAQRSAVGAELARLSGQLRQKVAEVL